jgi:hypothetical protein
MKKTSSLWWAFVTLLSLSWVFLAPIYHPPLLGAGIAFMVAAVGFAFWALPAGVHITPPPAIITGLAFVTAAAAFPFLGWGARTALMILSIGLLGLHLPWRRGRRIGLAMGLGGLFAAIQAGILGTYIHFVSHRHFALPLSFFDYWISRLFGIRTTAIGQQVFFPGEGGYLPVSPSWDQLALVFGVVIFGGVLLLTAFGSSRRKYWPGLLGNGVLIVSYLIVRRLILLLLVLDGGDVDLFWNVTETCLSFLPLFAILGSLNPIDSNILAERVHDALVPQKKGRWVGILALISVGTLMAASYLYLAAPGGRNGNVVYVDEAHGDWESTLIPMDKEWYGMPSAYNYSSLYDWFSYYYDMRQIETPLTEELLQGCDILIVKTPSILYSEGEIEAVRRFVRGGGGLFVIGDHTNVFGMTSCLNPLIRPFGLALNYDSTYELITGGFTDFETPAFTLDPVMQHVEHYTFLTSCSLSTPWNAWWTILDTGLLACHADYSTKDFFPEERYTLGATFGAFVQAAAVPYGLGRVLVFTDSTCFSNFSVFMDGYPQFLLSAMGFLGYRNPRFPLRSFYLVILIVCVVLIVWLTRKAMPSYSLVLIVGVLLGWSVFSWLCFSVHRGVYSLPEENPQIPYVYFDMHLSEGVISPRPTEYEWSNRFGTFFVWTQRVGQVPILLDGPQDRLLVSDRPYVIINPKSVVDEASLSHLEAYVEKEGGKLVLLDMATRNRWGLTTILQGFDLGVEWSDDGYLLLAGSEVEAILADPGVGVAWTAAQRGRGWVVLLSDSHSFSNATFGGSFTQPSVGQRALYDVEYTLFEDFLSTPLLFLAERPDLVERQERDSSEIDSGPREEKEVRLTTAALRVVALIAGALAALKLLVKPQ